MFIMESKRILITGSADQWLRFWWLKKMSQNRHIIGRMQIKHSEGDALTAFSLDSSSTHMVTADSAGRIKMWDVSETDWLVDGQGAGDKKDITTNDMSKNMRVKWFI